MKTITLVILSCVISGISAVGQSPDTTFIAAAVDDAVEQYQKLIGNQLLCYNGSAYVEPSRTEEPHGFFETDEWQQGSVEFEHYVFNNLFLIYDITQDKLVTETPNGNLMAFNSEKLNSFVINNHQFINLNKSDGHNTLPVTGFYELLYGGKSRVIALHQKQKQEKLESRQIHVDYEEHHKYFVFKNGRYYQVKGKKSILSVFSEQKHALKLLIKKNKISFGRNRQLALPRVAELYDSLIFQK